MNWGDGEGSNANSHRSVRSSRRAWRTLQHEERACSDCKPSVSARFGLQRNTAAMEQPINQLNTPLGTPRRARRSGATYYVNLLLLSFGFLSIFVAFSATQNLETSLNGGTAERFKATKLTVGSSSMALLYLVFALSCVLAPPIVQSLGPRTSLVAGGLCYVAFMAANLNPRWRFMLPAAALNGLGAAVVWCAQGAFLANCAFAYARATGKADEKAVLGRFNGIFFAVFQLSQIPGNVLGSLELPGSARPAEAWPTVEHLRGRSLLFAVFVALSVVGTVAFALLRSVDDGGGGGAEDARARESALMGQTLSLLRYRKLQLLLPVIIFSGLEQGFIWGDFTRDVVVPQLGDRGVGYIMSGFSVAGAFGSYAAGRLSDDKRVGRKPVLVLGALLHAGCIMALWWLHHMHPAKWGYSDAQTYAILGGVAVAWGVGDAVWMTQISVLLIAYFPLNLEAAFANLKLWSSLATAASFFGSMYLEHPQRVDVKLYILLGMLALSLTFVLLPNSARQRSAYDPL